MEDLSCRHKLIAQMSAAGVKQVDIAKELGLSESRVSTILNSEGVKAEIVRLMEARWVGAFQERFEALVPLASRAVEDILRDPNARHASKLKAAEIIFDRARGKPVQEIKQVDSTIRELLAEMRKNQPPVDPNAEWWTDAANPTETPS